MKHVSLLVCLFLFTNLLHAQVSIGIKAGYVKAWERYGDIGLPEDAKIHINGYQFSGIVELPISGLLSLRVEPGYIQRGAACFPGWINPTRDTRFRFNYVELPVLIEAHQHILGNKLSISGKAGYGAAYIVSAKRETVIWDSGEREFNKLDFDIDDWVNRFDHGIYAGAGLSYKIGKNNLFAEVTHYHGMVNVDKNNQTANRTMQYSLGYKITL